MSTWARAATGWGFEAAGVDRRLQLVLDEAEGVAHADLAPRRPAEDRRAVEQHDALDLGLAAGLEPAERADAQHGERIGWRPTRPRPAVRWVTSASTCSKTAANSSRLSANWW